MRMHLLQHFAGAVPWHETGQDNMIAIIPLGRIGSQNVWEKSSATFCEHQFAVLQP